MPPRPINERFAKKPPRPNQIQRAQPFERLLPPSPPRPCFVLGCRNPLTPSKGASMCCTGCGREKRVHRYLGATTCPGPRSSFGYARLRVSRAGAPCPPDEKFTFILPNRP